MKHSPSLTLRVSVILACVENNLRAAKSPRGRPPFFDRHGGQRNAGPATGLAGAGSFLTSRPSSHTTTNIDVIARFLDVPICVEQRDLQRWHVTVGPEVDSQRNRRRRAGGRKPPDKHVFVRGLTPSGSPAYLSLRVHLVTSLRREWFGSLWRVARNTVGGTATLHLRSIDSRRFGAKRRTDAAGRLSPVTGEKAFNRQSAPVTGQPLLRDLSRN